MKEGKITNSWQLLKWTVEIQLIMNFPNSGPSKEIICETNSTKQDNSHFYLGAVPNDLSHLFAFQNPIVVELDLVN